MTKGRKIILIEDDPLFVRFCKVKFEQNGFEIVCVEDGQEAHEKIMSEKPDLIVLDIGLPNKNGYQILEELKKEEENKNIDVIILTKLGQESDKEKGMRLGAIKYMVKVEVKLEEVMEEVKKYFSANMENKEF